MIFSLKFPFWGFTGGFSQNSEEYVKDKLTTDSWFAKRVHGDQKDETKEGDARGILNSPGTFVTTAPPVLVTQDDSVLPVLPLHLPAVPTYTCNTTSHPAGDQQSQRPRDWGASLGQDLVLKSAQSQAKWDSWSHVYVCKQRTPFLKSS